MEERHPHHHSFFWPIILVGVGVIWLLRNLGIIPMFSLGSIIQFWPLLLIVLGLDILFSRRFPWIGSVVGLLAVAAVVAYLVTGPKLGLESGGAASTDTYSEPVGSTETVKYVFDTSSSPVDVSALDANDDNLILANITHRGTMRFDVTGSENKTVRMSESYQDTGWLYWDFSFDHLKWDIALNPDVPTEFEINGGSGSIDVDLRGIQLTDFSGDFGSGSSDIKLPETDDAYTADIESGSGSVTLDLPEETSLTMTLDTGSGSTSINVPSDAALRIEVMDDGSGSLSLPDGLRKSSDSSSFSIGAWQTDNYDDADVQILIKILGQGSGSISIH